MIKKKIINQTTNLFEEVNPCLCDEITQAIEERNRQRLDQQLGVSVMKNLNDTQTLDMFERKYTPIHKS